MLHLRVINPNVQKRAMLGDYILTNIKLQNSEELVVIDDCDKQGVEQHEWSLDRRGNIYTIVQWKNGQNKVYLHCLIMRMILGRKLCQGEYVDYVDVNDKFNNRRNNIHLDSSRKWKWEDGNPYTRRAFTRCYNPKSKSV